MARPSKQAPEIIAKLEQANFEGQANNQR